MYAIRRRRVRLVLAAILLVLFVYIRFVGGPQSLQGAWAWGERIWETAWNPEDAEDPRCRWGHGLNQDLLSVRTLLELYKMQHHGRYPTDLVEAFTTSDGSYGPYLTRFPANPFVPGPNSDKVDMTSLGGSTAGWFYDPETGIFKPDDDAHTGL